MTKEFKCDICNAKFSNNGNLKTHIKTIHAKIKNYECDKCNFTFSCNSHLKRHIKSIHLNIKDIKCVQCDFKCSENIGLKRHIKQVHQRSQESKRMSLGEFKIHTLLKKFKVEFKQEFTFQDLRSEKNSLLRYDFGIKNKNNYLLIEFDGGQHFKKIRWSSVESEKQINERFEYIQQCDKQKNDYVRSNNHQILRIRYDDVDVQNKILDFIIKYYDIDTWKKNQIVIKY